MKGPAKKFSSISERIQAYKTAATAPASSPSQSQRPIAVRSVSSGAGASCSSSSSSPTRGGSPDPGRFAPDRSRSRIAAAGGSRSGRSSQARSSREGSPKPSVVHQEDTTARSSGNSTTGSIGNSSPAGSRGRTQSTVTSGTATPSPQAVHRVAQRQVSEPVTIRSPRLVHSVAPILRSSPMATPPLPKSSPPVLPASSPPSTSQMRPAGQSTPPLPKAPIPTYSPKAKRSSTTTTTATPESQRKPLSNLAMGRQFSQPMTSSSSSPSSRSGFSKLRATKSTADSDDANRRGFAGTVSTTSTDVLTDLLPVSRSSTGKSSITRDSGCESSESTNVSPEFSPPSSAVSSDSVFASLKDSQLDTVIGGGGGGGGDLAVQQICAERDHLQLVLKNAEMTLCAVEKERDALIAKSRDQHVELASVHAELNESRQSWSATCKQATACVHDGRSFFVQQQQQDPSAAPVWYGTMVEILDSALAALDGSLPPGVVARTCSSSVRESLQKQLEAVSKQLMEVRRERRALQERSSAWERERRQLQNEVVATQHQQSTSRSDRNELMSQKEQRVLELQAKCKLLEHEKERENKQARTLSTRNAALEKTVEEARQQLALVDGKQSESKRFHEGELVILRNSIRELKRERASMENFVKADVESRRERHELEIRCRDSQIQQMEEETEQLTQQVQDLEGTLSTRDPGDPDSGKTNVTDLNIRINRLMQDLTTERTGKKQLEAKLARLEAELKKSSSNPTARPLSGSFVTSLSREPSPAVSIGRKYSPATGVRGTIITKALSVGDSSSQSSPSSAAIQRSMPPPSSLPTTAGASAASSHVSVRTHVGAKPSQSANRHTVGDCTAAATSSSSSSRAKSDSEGVRVRGTSSASSSPLTHRYGRHFSSGAGTHLSPMTGSVFSLGGGGGSNSGSTANSPQINHWKVLQRTVQASSNFQVTSKRTMLLEWCKQKLNSYRGVDIQNFHRSWRNGLAFCAMLDHFDGTLFDFESLDVNDMESNLKLAFESGERLGIYSLLDVDDMVMMEQPEWHSVMTYVSSIYNHFNPKK